MNRAPRREFRWRSGRAPSPGPRLPPDLGQVEVPQYQQRSTRQVSETLAHSLQRWVVAGRAVTHCYRDVSLSKLKPVQAVQAVPLLHWRTESRPCAIPPQLRLSTARPIWPLSLDFRTNSSSQSENSSSM